MPELPEIETIRRSLAPQLIQKTITAVTVHDPRLRYPIPTDLAAILTGKSLENIHRRSKYLLFEFPHGHLIIHLGMSGNLRILSPSVKLRQHDCLDLIFAQTLCLRYHDPRRFGSILWTSDSPSKHPLLTDLGPEPLENEFQGEYLYRVAHKRQKSIKTFIMDGHIVAGVGNIYANEALFLAGIRPTRLAGQIDLPEYQRLANSIKQVLTVAIAQGGTTLRDFTDSTGKTGRFQQSLQVYGRAGEKCQQCGNVIQQQIIGQRSSYFCPVCQK